MARAEDHRVAQKVMQWRLLKVTKSGNHCWDIGDGDQWMTGVGSGFSYFRPFEKADDDYLVLKRVRETWNERALEKFSLELCRLCHIRVTEYTTVGTIELFARCYEVGFFSLAALSALPPPATEVQCQ